ncbi:MAG: InlB B-repeat-containing protein [Dehalococcoidia bacterium]
MKTMLGLRRYRYLTRLGGLLVAVALIAGTVGCPSDAVDYQLTISSTEGGSVTTPGEGISAYSEGEGVSLVAEAQEGYRFVEWTGDVGTIADVNAASTTITMNDNYSITASFMAQYVLTIDSTDGGEVTAPGEGTFAYDLGTAVNLVATPGSGCQFVEWTGDIDTVVDVNGATTTITMNADYAITATFEVEQVVIYDFVAKASHSRTIWESGAGELPFPGATNDNRGFACYRTDIVLEDGQTYDKVLETHPQWVDDGFIRGGYLELYEMGYKIEDGDRFYAKVGLFKNATAGNVKFVVWIFAEGGYAVSIAEVTDTYDGALPTIDVDLSPYVSDYGVTFILEVQANGPSNQDWAAWVEAKVIRYG